MDPISKHTVSPDAAFKLAAIIDSSNDAIISMTLGGIITSWNLAAEKIFGYTKAEVLDKPIQLILPPNKLREEEEILQRISRDEKVEHFETVRVAKDGSIIQVSISVSPIKNEHSQVVGASKIARDITEQKLSEEKKAILAAIVNSSHDAIISKNLDGIITSWNKSAERMFGYTEKEAIGQHITLIIPRYRLQEENMIIGRIKAGDKLEHFETKRITKEGKEIDLSITVSPIRNEVGKVTGASKIARDISEKIKAQEQLESFMAELTKLNRHKDEFISVASHELNTPLTSLKIYLQILEENHKRQLNPEANITYVTKAIQLSDKLAKLVKDLLDVSKIETGKLQLQKEPFNFTILLQETVDAMRLISRNHKIVYGDNTTPVMVLGDRERLEQALINIISNAIKYSPGADTVIVEVKEEVNSVSISITDFGIGIPADQIHNLFSRFFRVEKSSHAFAGLGIGLYISSQIISGHNGKVEVTSEEGKGSVFTIVLPRYS